MGDKPVLLNGLRTYFCGIVQNMVTTLGEYKLLYANGIKQKLRDLVSFVTFEFVLELCETFVNSL